MSKRVALIGYGYLGKAYHKVFPDAVVYDEPQQLLVDPKKGKLEPAMINGLEIYKKDWLNKARLIVNECDMALIAVPTDLKNGKLDMSIVEDVVGWLETPLILIKSALMPGTTDKLVEKTGKKIAVSVELIGEGTYFVPQWKYPHTKDPRQHMCLTVGGQPEVAEKCAEILWERMSPDARINVVTALEAEITKLSENVWGAMKVTYANVVYDVAKKYGASFIHVNQALTSDPRVEGMHTRVVSFKRGWKSKCFDKDVPAFAEIADSEMIRGLLKDNERHNE